MRGLPAGTQFTTNAPIPLESLIIKTFIENYTYLPITNSDIQLGDESSRRFNWNSATLRWEAYEDYGGGPIMYAYIEKISDNTYNFVTLVDQDMTRFVIIGTENGQYFNSNSLLRIDARPVANRCYIDDIRATVISQDMPLPYRETVYFELYHGDQKYSPAWNEFSITKSHDGVTAGGGIVDSGYSLDFGITSGDSSGSCTLSIDGIDILKCIRLVI